MQVCTPLIPCTTQAWCAGVWFAGRPAVWSPWDIKILLALGLLFNLGIDFSAKATQDGEAEAMAALFSSW